MVAFHQKRSHARRSPLMFVIALLGLGMGGLVLSMEFQTLVAAALWATPTASLSMIPWPKTTQPLDSIRSFPTICGSGPLLRRALRDDVEL